MSKKLDTKSQISLGDIGVFSTKHPVGVLLAASIITVFALWGALQLRLNNNLLDLLSSKIPSVKEVKKIEKETGGLGVLMVTASSSKPSANTFFLKKLQTKLVKLPEVDYVSYRRPAKEFLQKHSLLFMELKDLQILKKRFKAKIRYEHRQKDPLFLNIDDDDKDPGLPIKDLKKKYSTRTKKMAEYYRAEGGRYQAIQIRPKKMARNVKFSQRLLKKIKGLVKELNPSSFHPSMSVGYHGPFASAVNEVEGIRRDIMQSAFFTFAFLLLLLWGFFRKIRSLPIIMIPLTMAVVWTLALTFVFIRYLNVITAFIGIVLLGLGIDYGIHILSRYIRKRREGRDVADAVRISLAHTGMATLVGCATTAATFASLLFSEFEGFAQFGFISGVGILLCLVSIFTVMPALITLFERRKALVEVDSPKADIALENFGLFPRYRGVLWGSLFFIGLSAFFMPKVGFEYNRFNVSYHPGGFFKHFAKEKRFKELFSENLSPTAFLVKSKKEADALVKALQKKIKGKQR